MRSHLIPTFLAVATASLAHANDARVDAEVYFDFDSSVLRNAAQAELATIAEEADRRPDTRVVLRGHADPRGTGAYNAGLSSRRAEAVREHLVKLGVERDRIVLAIYGEDAPPRPTLREERRVGINVTGDPLYVIVDRTLADGIALIWGTPVTAAQIDGPQPEQVAER